MDRMTPKVCHRPARRNGISSSPEGGSKTASKGIQKPAAKTGAVRNRQIKSKEQTPALYVAQEVFGSVRQPGDGDVLAGGG